MRKYYPKSMMFYFSLSILMIFIMVLIFVCVYFWMNFSSLQTVLGWLCFIFSVFGIAYFSFKSLHVIKRRIVLFDNKIYAQEDLGGKTTKLQYRLDIEFNDIQNIDITVDSNNSLNQPMRFVISPMPNILLYLSNGKVARINLYYYSKKQTIDIIDHIIERKKLIDPTFASKTGREILEKLKKINFNHY